MILFVLRRGGSGGSDTEFATQRRGVSAVRTLIDTAGGRGREGAEEDSSGDEGEVAGRQPDGSRVPCVWSDEEATQPQLQGGASTCLHGMAEPVNALAAAAETARLGGQGGSNAGVSPMAEGRTVGGDGSGSGAAEEHGGSGQQSRPARSRGAPRPGPHPSSPAEQALLRRYDRRASRPSSASQHRQVCVCCVVCMVRAQSVLAHTDEGIQLAILLLLLLLLPAPLLLYVSKPGFPDEMRGPVVKAKNWVIMATPMSLECKSRLGLRGKEAGH
eukprot:scaffold128460_cov16-Tisochrysis_lutea.AAC.1